MLTRMQRVIMGRHLTSKVFVLASANNQPGTVIHLGRYTNSSTQGWRSSLHVHIATLTSTADTSHSLTPDELRSFLLTGVLGVITGEKWTNKSLLLATVRNEMGELIHRNKYTYNDDRHTEEQLMEELRRDPENEGEDRKLINRAKEIELLSNYSPCDGCARKLIKLKTDYRRLKITIKCAHLYNVWPQRKRWLAWANILGLRDMDHAGIRLQAFTKDDWLQLLLDSGNGGSSLVEVLQDCGYDTNTARRIAWGRSLVDDTTREVLGIITHHDADVADVHKVYKRVEAAAKKGMPQDKRGAKRWPKRRWP